MQAYLPTDLHRTAEARPSAKSRTDAVWRLDWLSTEMPVRAKFLLLTDCCSRKVLAAVGPCTDKSDCMIVGELDRVAAHEGYPKEVRTDGGFADAAREILWWCSKYGVYCTVFEPITKHRGV